jgi:Tfp pilus assembly protein PilF
MSGPIASPNTNNSASRLLAEAIAHHQAGRLAEAEALYRQVLIQDSENGDALHLLGLIVLARGTPREAAELIGKALKRAPKSPLFLSNLATAQNAAGDGAKALATLKKAVKAAPKNAQVWCSLGLMYASRGAHRKAEHALRRSLKIDPAQAEAWNTLGLMVAQQGQNEEAREILEQGFSLVPDAPALANSLGVIARETGAIEDSIGFLEIAASLAPQSASTLANLGISLTDAGRFEDALVHFEAALALDDSDSEIWRAYAKPLIALGRKEPARMACDRATALAPGDGRALWERALVNLLAGQFDAGWSDYRARLMVDRAHWPIPERRLEDDLSGHHIVVMGEQGLGEELFFLRFGASLKNRGARVTACVDERLVSMVRRIEFIDDALAKTADPEFEATAEAWLMGDLPWLVGECGDTPPPAPIAALESKRATLARRLADTNGGPFIALTWRAGIESRTTLYKQAPGELLLEATRELPGTLIALQRNPREGEILELAEESGREVLDFTDLNDDLEGMLALMEQIDAYAGVSNTNMHLAAAAQAAGARLHCHVLVPSPAEFRWLAEGDRSPWFPGFTPYREDPRCGWERVAERLAEGLQKEVNRGSQSFPNPRT